MRLTRSGRKIVAGKSMDIAIAGPMPGIAPITMPPIAPTKRAIKTCRSNKLFKPNQKFSIKNKFS